MSLCPVAPGGCELLWVRLVSCINNSPPTYLYGNLGPQGQAGPQGSVSWQGQRWGGLVSKGDLRSEAWRAWGVLLWGDMAPIFPNPVDMVIVLFWRFRILLGVGGSSQSHGSQIGWLEPFFLLFYLQPQTHQGAPWSLCPPADPTATSCLPWTHLFWRSPWIPCWELLVRAIALHLAWNEFSVPILWDLLVQPFPQSKSPWSWWWSIPGLLVHLHL